MTNEVHVRPAMVGFFFTGSAVIGILVSQFLAGRSDRRGDRKQLIVFCCLLGVLACLLFAWNRSYFVLLFVGVFLSSFGSTANPQMFALAREHADKTGPRGGDVQLDSARPGVAGVGDRPAAGLRAGDGLRLLP
ncbi:Sugar efflux transporter B [Raoultella terrigena]|uniref:Sugar efflux transporter B n=1 Tax=Raoultella terrigena TaxID=577 RepID=A0A4U9D023_RAOTE|nr:Sugar efflux transporter B [Raoultella terrigena]